MKDNCPKQVIMKIGIKLGVNGSLGSRQHVGVF